MPTGIIDSKTAKTVRGWVDQDRGDIERTARWMAYTLRIGGIRVCRDIIQQALRDGPWCDCCQQPESYCDCLGQPRD